MENISPSSPLLKLRKDQTFVALPIPSSMAEYAYQVGPHCRGLLFGDTERMIPPCRFELSSFWTKHLFSPFLKLHQDHRFMALRCPPSLMAEYSHQVCPPYLDSFYFSYELFPLLFIRVACWLRVMRASVPETLRRGSSTRTRKVCRTLIFCATIYTY